MIMEQNHSMDHHNISDDCSLELDTKVRRVVLFVIYLFIFTAGLLENLLVLWVNWRRRRSANGVLFCVLNVSLADLMLVVTLPFFMMEVAVDKVWLWGEFLCKVTYLVYTVSFYGSSFFLALMALERYLSLAQPAFPALFPVVGRRRWLLCGGVWLFSFFLALLDSVHIVLMQFNDPGCHWYPENGYIEWVISISFLQVFFQFLIPGAVIITCNVLIARAVRAAPDIQDQRDVWLVHVYSAVFVLCRLPYNLQVLFNAFDYIMIDKIIYSCNFTIALHFSYEIVKVLTLFHCIADPILYNFLSKSFRNNLINTLVSYVSKERNVPHLREGTRPTEGQSKISVSTSQSDVGS